MQKVVAIKSKISPNKASSAKDKGKTRSIWESVVNHKMLIMEDHSMYTPVIDILY